MRHNENQLIVDTDILAAGVLLRRCLLSTDPFRLLVASRERFSVILGDDVGESCEAVYQQVARRLLELSSTPPTDARLRECVAIASAVRFLRYESTVTILAAGYGFPDLRSMTSFPARELWERFEAIATPPLSRRMTAMALHAAEVAERGLTAILDSYLAT